MEDGGIYKQNLAWPCFYQYADNINAHDLLFFKLWTNRPGTPSFYSESAQMDPMLHNSKYDSQNAIDGAWVCWWGDNFSRGLLAAFW